MKACRKCGDEIPKFIIYEGHKKNFQNRSFCLKCSPFKQHNTSATNPTGPNGAICRCGESDPIMFYSYRPKDCRKCHTNAVNARAVQQKADARKHMGGKCQACGYCAFEAALQIHHKDPLIKDEKFVGWRGWSWGRILKELETCVLLCANCHTAFHAGEKIVW